MQECGNPPANIAELFDIDAYLPDSVTYWVGYPLVREPTAFRCVRRGEQLFAWLVLH